MLGHGSLVDKINVLPFESIKRNIERVSFPVVLEPTCSKMLIVFSVLDQTSAFFAYQSRAHFCGYRDKENTLPALGACTQKGSLPTLRDLSVL